MQPFRFRLERVFDWQAKVCGLEEEKLRACLFDLARAEETLARLRAGRLAVEREFVQRAGFSANDLRALAGFRLDAAAKERLLLADVGARERETKEQRGKAVAERRRLEMLSRLRNRCLQNHNAAVDKALDALALECHSCKLVAEGNGGGRA